MIIIEKHNRKQLLVAVSQEPCKLIYFPVHARKIATDLNSIKKNTLTQFGNIMPTFCRFM